MVTLETILQQHFGCRKPFLKKPRKTHGGQHTEHFTRQGGKAYDRLVTLLDDLEALGVIRGAATAAQQLDHIVHNEY